MNTRKTQPSKSKETVLNPWLFLTIGLVIVLAAFIFYDKSPTFHKSINSLFGIEDSGIYFKKQINITVLTDTDYENPPYNVEEQVESLQEELADDVTVNFVDIDDEKGKKLVEELDLTAVPVLLFDEVITETSFYLDASSFFSKEGDWQVLRLMPFKYLKLPEVGDGHVKGNENALVTIIEYSSFTCPYCAQMKPILDKAFEEYPDKIRLVFKHFDRGGSDIFLAAATECAAEQDNFWGMHDYILDNQRDLAEKDVDIFLSEGATEIGIDVNIFNTCREESDFSSKIKAHTDEAYKFGVSGTPAFFVNDIFIGGAVSFESLKAAIDSFN